jgi:hypothetical protein
MQDFDWMRDAACLGMVDPMWDRATPSVEALRVCFRCPVQRQCLRYGLDRVDASDAGVLGGLGLYDRGADSAAEGYGRGDAGTQVGCAGAGRLE